MGKEISGYSMWSRLPGRSEEFSILVPANEVDNMREWCIENLVGDFHFAHQFIADGRDSGWRAVLVIELPEDVVAAKLRWS